MNNSRSVISSTHMRRFRRLVEIRLRRFRSDAGGASAVEFAIVSLPFIAIVLAVLEFSIVYFANESLELTASKAARLVMTGQAQNSGYTAATFKTAMCNTLLPPLTSCDSLYLNVVTYSGFNTASVTPSYTKSGDLDTSSLSYAPGAAGSVVVVQAYYQWPIFFPLLNSGLVTQSGNRNLLIATAVFQNEPYQ
jgi:Flp pilus assembly protein TadG